MINIYKSLKSKLHHSTLAGKTDAVRLSRVERIHVVPVKDKNSLTREIEMLEKIIANEFGKLKTTVNAHEATALESVRQSKQLSDSFKADVATLQAKLKQTEEIIAKNDSTRQELEKNLTAEIGRLQSRLNEKDESLAKREEEISEYKSKADNSAKQISELQLAVRKANEDAQAANVLTKSLLAKITELESLLKRAQEAAEEKATTIEGLTAHVEELEKAATDKREHFSRQDEQIANLQGQLKRLTTGIGEMSFLFRETAAFAGINAESAGSTADQHGAANLTHENSTRAASTVARVFNTVRPQDTVSSDVLKLMVSELAEFTNVMENLASLLVRRHAKTLGESIDKFPLKRLPELLDALATEISDENRRNDFRHRLSQHAHIASH